MLDISEVHIEDSSLHERICAIYTRNEYNELLFMDGKHSAEIQDLWTEVSYLLELESLVSDSPMGISERYFDVTQMERFGECQGLIDLIKLISLNPTFATTSALGLKISEICVENERQTRGIISFSVGRNEKDFDKWFESLVLCEAELGFAQCTPVAHDSGKAAEITKIFDEELRNVTNNDMWTKGGREYFFQKVLFFTSRRLPVQACLPAFPCKSSNTEKVVGTDPDKGEEMALRRLIKVAEMIKSIYAPGVSFWIVSDGHVFSDCIGVDDNVVDTYSDKLCKMYERIESSERCINFCSLPVLFTSKLKKFEKRYTESVKLPHFLGTELDEKSETCREVLMSGCSTDPAALRSLIDNSDPAKLALYRGFSKFMLEDLALHPNFMAHTKKSRKKLSSKVAFEMIKACFQMLFFRISLTDTF